MFILTNGIVFICIAAKIGIFAVDLDLSYPFFPSIVPAYSGVYRCAPSTASNLCTRFVDALV